MIMRPTTKATNLLFCFNYSATNICQFSTNSDTQKIANQVTEAPEKLDGVRNLKKFANELKKSFDNFEGEKKSEDTSNYWPLSVDEWERTRKQWDDDRRQFYETVEEQKPVYFKPGPMKRRFILWTGMYSAESEIPEQLNSYKVAEHFKSWFRKLAFYIFLVYCGIAFIYRCDETENVR